MKGDFYDFWINVPEWTIKQLVCLLNGYDPAVLDAPTDEENLETKKYLLQEFQKWQRWAGDCPGINDHKGSWGDKPPILSRPIDAKLLVIWANKKKGVSIPKELESLLYVNKSEKVDPSLGEKEKENLLITIALLSKVIADNKSLKAGTVDNPNRSEIARLSYELISDEDGNPLIHGLAESSIRNRITQGLMALEKSL